MSVNAVKKDRTSPNYTCAIAQGAVAGYSLKWLLPVTPQEKDDLYVLETKKIYKKAAQKVKQEIEIIKNTTPKVDGYDQFIKICNEKNLKDKIKKPYPIEVLTLLEKLRDIASETKSIEFSKLNNYTKSLRPTFTFIALGGFAGCVINFIKNNLSSTNK